MMKSLGQPDILSFGKKQVSTTHRSKIFWPEENITKGMVIDYYQKMAAYILPYLKNRPESLRRNPDGIRSEGFFQKNIGTNVPSWVVTENIYSESAKRNIDYVLCNDKATLAYLNNLGCIELNPWNSTVQSPDNPDYMIIDIDPSDKNNFDQVVETAIKFKDVLDAIGIEGFCKTSGATGLHIYVPTGKKYHYDQVKDFAFNLCKKVCDMIPSITTMERNLQKRSEKKIYLDYLQNRRGQTVASVYSIRPRKGATVSTPLDWKEVYKGLNPHDFTINTIFKRLEAKGDLFKGVLGKGVNLNRVLN